jgi:hypothetical protein
MVDNKNNNNTIIRGTLAAKKVLFPSLYKGQLLSILFYTITM